MPLRPLLIAFMLAIASFFASTLYSQRSSRAIDAAAQSIASNAMPSIEHLSAARTDLRTLWIDLHPYLRPSDVAERKVIEETRARVDAEIDAYLALPTYAGERSMWQKLQHDLAQVDRTVAALLAHVEQAPVGPRTPLRLAAQDAVDHAVVTLRELIDFDARHAAEDATEIKRARVRADRIALTLDGVSALFTLLVAWLVVRALRSYERVREEHNQLIASRADELEQFAGRVAHDILSPLSATSVALQLLRRKVDSDELRATVDRGGRGLVRVQTIVDGLLRFARAGARPEPGVRTRLRPVVEELIQELQPVAAETDVVLTAEPVADATVACNPGVLTSLLENLVRNAIKYMLNARERRVVIRAAATDERVRVEVEDTGPGIAPSLLPRIFQPYVRGADSGKPGIGLGLATVRRIVESHGGTVGVQSSPAGSLFWFELPRAPELAAGEPAIPSLH